MAFLTSAASCEQSTRQTRVQRRAAHRRPLLSAHAQPTSYHRMCVHFLNRKSPLPQQSALNPITIVDQPCSGRAWLPFCVHNPIFSQFAVRTY